MITLELNTVDISSKVDFESLWVSQNLTNIGSNASFCLKNPTALNPKFNDDIRIFDGASVIFAGKVSDVSRETDSVGREIYKVVCVDHVLELDRLLVSRAYENETVENIIDDIITSFAPAFTSVNVACTFNIQKIVFNQMPISQCLKKLADIMQYDWYVDEDKDIHFFSKFTNTAPFDLTDTAGNYVFKSLQRNEDGSQVVNRVKIRGGEYNGDSYTDVITVKGNDQKSFLLPYKMANLAIELDTGAGYVSQDVGIDFIDAFPAKDVLYAYESKSFRFENALSDGDKIQFTGNPKTPILAIAEDPDSVVKYGVIEKLIRDNSIASNAIARKRASAELLAFAETIIDANFETYTSGLRTGMLINIGSTIRGIDDDLLIKSVSFSTRTPNDFYYKVSCISTKRYNLIDLLRKIITPDPLEADASEVAEQVFALNETINSLVEINLVNPYFPIEEVISTDDTYLDAVAPGSVEWVYGFYVPTDITDVKRMARFDRDSIYS